MPGTRKSSETKVYTNFQNKNPISLEDVFWIGQNVGEYTRIVFDYYWAF